MIDRPRAHTVAWAAACLGAFCLLTGLVAAGWGPLVDADAGVTDAWSGWAQQSPALLDVLRFLELATGTIATLVAAALLTGALATRSHPRAAAYVALVTGASLIATHLLKWAVGRARPEAQAGFAELSNGSFPSGHAAYVAGLGGAVVVVIAMLVRRPGLRHLLVGAVAVLALLVCADRLLLGRHYPSDVVGGLLLGGGLALLGLLLASPLPRGHAGTVAPFVDSVPGATRDLHVVLNPAKVEDVGQFRAIVSTMAAESGWSEPVWHLTTVEDPGTGQASAAAVGGADLVMVCGGDGTVREVCAELASTGVPVGIVPAGTGNLLARNLDIPLYIRSAIDVTLNGQDRAIDMVEVSGDGFEDSHFMVMAGMGFDAAIMEGVNEDLKNRVGWVAYVLSGFRSLMFPAGRFEISVDGGEPTRHRARTVVVGNVGFLQAGLPLLPDASIDDGQLDIVVLHPRTFFSWIPLAWRVLLKLKHTDELVNRMTGREVSIRAAGDTPRQLDGDSIGPGRELTMRCVHGRLLVRVPR